MITVASPAAKIHLFLSTFEMRLRFRGACWDETATPTAPPSVPISLPYEKRESNNNSKRTPRGLAPSEGRVGTPTELSLLPRRPQPIAKLSPWSCAVAFKQSWTVRERDQLESEELVGGKDRRPSTKAVVRSFCKLTVSPQR